MLLSKKCQAQKIIPSHKDMNQLKKQSQPLIKAVDLKEI